MLLKNGTIYDGSLNKSFQGSILYEDSHIIKISQDQSIFNDYSGEVIDCTGLCIAPGFIDAHSHNDFFAGYDSHLKYFAPFILQGITTMIGGNCGFSAAGYTPNSPHMSQIGSGLFSNRGKDFSSFSSWGKTINHNIPVNLVSLVGHGTLRIGVNGMGSNKLTPEQLEQMGEVLDQDLSEGAAGLSYGLMYEPSQFAPIEELEYLAKIVKKHNKIITFHERACSKVSTSYSPPIGGRPHNLRALDEIIGICKRVGVKTEYSHLIFVGERSWDTMDECISLFEQTKKEGYQIGFDLYPMEFGASIITVILPIWYLGMKEEKKRSLSTRIRLFIEVMVAKTALGFGFSDILIANTHGQATELEGKRISEIAKINKKSAYQTYLDIVDLTHANCSVLMYKYSTPKIIERLRTHEQSLYMTDAWIEEEGIQNFACYYSFPKFITLARDNHTSLEQAIHKMSGATATYYNILDRGFIKEGYHADFTIFDLNQLSFVENSDQTPQGIRYVINNGTIVVKDGKLLTKDVTTIGEFIPIHS